MKDAMVPTKWLKRRNAENNYGLVMRLRVFSIFVSSNKLEQ